MQKKKKVLEITLESHNTGGVVKMLFELFKHMDKSDLQIDFLTPDGGAYDPFEDEIKNDNGNVFDLGIDRKSIIDKVRYNHRLKVFLKENKYDIVHINSGAFFFCFQVAYIAKKCGVNAIIVHSHNAVNYSKIKRMLIDLFKPWLEHMSNKMLACSRLAADSLFPHNCVETGAVQIINNGIETDKYRFDLSVRDEYRNQLSIKSNTVYCHIGRFVEQKNHSFLIDVFKEISILQDDAKLLLIGDGELKNQIEKKVIENDLWNKVSFLGFRDDIEKILNAVDAFILPSIYEGLPVVAIEAQTNGVITICSDEVTSETGITDKYCSIPLSKSPREWAETIIAKVNSDFEQERECYSDIVKSKEYDISISAEKLKDIYMEE